MRNQRFEQKKSAKNDWDNDDRMNKKHKMSGHRDERNWKNKILKEEDDEIDDQFFHFDDEE